MKALIAFLTLGFAIAYGASTRGNVDKNNVESEGVTYNADLETVVGMSGGLSNAKFCNAWIPDGKPLIFYNDPFQTDGTVSSWQFIAEGSGDVCFYVFRPVKPKVATTNHEHAYEVKYEFRGKNCINGVAVHKNEPDYVFFDVARKERLRVKSGDVVGVDIASSTLKVCMLFSSSPQQLNGHNLKGVMRVTSTEINNGFVNVKEEEDFFAVPGFVAKVVSTRQTLDIMFGENRRSGFPVVYTGGTWGLICDLWYHTHGWPPVFCHEKGFPDIEDAFHAESQVTDEVRKQQIVLPNPHCKTSLNKTIASCEYRIDHNCTMNDLIYIKCRDNIELVGGNGVTNGKLMVYEMGVWGSVCDDRVLDLTNEDHYAHVACRQLGFNKCSNIDLVLNQPDTADNVKTIAQQSIFGFNMECEKGCRSLHDCCYHAQVDFDKTHCTHKHDVFLTCATE